MGTGVLILVASALAAPPGGLRLSSAMPEVEAQLRSDWVVREAGPDGAHQLSASIRAPLRLARLPLVFQAELPVVQAWDHGSLHTGTGQLRLTARVWTEVRREERRMGTSTWGIELGIPTRHDTPQGAWVLSSEEARPAVEVLYAIESSARLPDDGWLHLRAAGGLKTRQDGPPVEVWPPSPMFDFGAAAITQIYGTPLSVGNTIEVMTDETPVATRHWLRTDYGGGFSFDAGVQIPWVSLIAGPRELVLVGQVSWQAAAR